MLFQKKIDESKLKIPAHVAIIMDGNGRWAKKRMLPRKAGHKKGAEALEEIIEDAAKLGVKYLTVYAFSTENWNRSTEEVDALMDLFAQYLKDCVERTNKNNMRVKVIGERSRLRSYLIERINEVEETSKNNTGITFVLAVNYGSRDEITRAVRKLSSNVKDGAINPEEIDMDTISSYLDTASIPDPDLLIRTSGEERLSNFLLWQLAYSEFYFTDCLWPDFNRDELIKAIYAYTKRDRRFGGRKK